MNFFKTFLASCLGSLTALVALFIIMIFVMAGIVAGLVGSASGEEQVIVRKNSVLLLDLDTEITELQAEDPFAGLPIPGADNATIGLLQLKQAISHAKTDDKIKGIYLNVSYPMAGFSTIEEIRESLLDFREEGKWVIAYSDAMSEKAYYLASAADKVYLNQGGDV